MFNKKFFYIFLFLCAIAGFILIGLDTAKAIGEGTWELKTTSAGWGQRTTPGVTVFNNKMWVIGGQTGSSCKNDVWYSSDGITWTQATANAGWAARTYHGVLVFKNKLWVIGGTNVFTNVRMNDARYSEDGVEWYSIAPAPWIARDGHAVLVFNNKMWVLGGSYGGNDVWNTDNGVDWTQTTPSASWSSRVLHGAVVFNNKMWVMGGSTGGTRKNDVWYSSDGATWTQATANAGWSPRNSFGLTVHDGKMWVMGGLTSNGRVNDVWYSSDGITWTQATANAGWAVRNLFGALTFNNKIWVMGGGGSATGSYLSDVWAMTASTPAPAPTMTCNFVWPQQVVVDGVAHSCFANVSRGFCNYTKVQQGVAECCDWHEGAGYSNCASLNTICTENWSCGSWSSCQSGQQTRTCADANSCGTTAGRPAVSQSCVCAESWSCGDWSSCQSGQQTRTCADANSCGTTATKPAVQQSCQVQCQESWSCADWSSCSNSQQTRTCVDSNSCGTTASKPALIQNCICLENWSCGDWSSCQSGQQTRTCADANSCGTTASKPALAQGCVCSEDWICGDWSSCANGQQARTCSDANSCSTNNNKPALTQNCGSTCAENWSCGSWSACAGGNQTRTCADANSCGTTASKPALAQGCVCSEDWICGDWSSCVNGQQTKTCADSNNCGTEKNKPAVKQNCQVLPEVKPLLPESQPIELPKPIVPIPTLNQIINVDSVAKSAKEEKIASPEVVPVTFLKSEFPINNEKMVIEKNQEGVFTIVSGSSSITTSLEVISSSSKPYLKTSQGLKEIKNSPEEIRAKIADKVSAVEKIEIKEQNEKPIFSVSGIKKVKFLFFFPISVKMEFQVDLETGEIISIKKPWWFFW